MKKLKLRTFLCGTQVVGIIHTLADLYAALADPDIADIFEWRVDCINCKEIVEGIKKLRRLGKLIIITVRDHNEGGKKPEWDLEKREALMWKYLHLADFIDVEALNAYSLRYLIARARKLGIGVIISAHFLEHFPSNGEFLWGIEMYQILGDFFKVAIKIESRGEMTRFSKMILPLMRDPDNHGRIVPMATGYSHGPSSRIMFAKQGARFVYGFIATSVIEGQWSTLELRRKIGQTRK
jgi:3-dehydroquinate dehydratase type I